jgi:rhomboid protease GluP
LWGFAPAIRALGTDLGFVPFVIGTCAVVYILTLIASRGNVRMSGLFGFLGPSGLTLIAFGASGADPVFVAGRWWTVLSAGWLHAGALHIIVNMVAVRQLAPGVAELYGPGRMVIIYTAGSVVGFTLSSLAGQFMPRLPIIGGAGLTVGASASIAALIGALLSYGRRSGSSMARSYASSYAMMILLQGAFIPGIDNYAHVGGFAGGYLAGLLLDPLKPERIDHLLMAVGCLVLSILSIVYSVLNG